MVRQIWITDDGEQFDNFLDAGLHEARQKLRSALKGEVEEFIGYSNLSSNMEMYEGDGHCDYSRISMHNFAADIVVEFIESLPEELRHNIYFHFGVM